MHLRKLLLVLAVGLGGCGGGDAFTPPPQAGTDFFQFVQDQVAATSDDTDPVDVTGIDFSNTDVEDENAFDMPAGGLVAEPDVLARRSSARWVLKRCFLWSPSGGMYTAFLVNGSDRPKPAAFIRSRSLVSTQERRTPP